tara:strand:- start:3761 stop:7093 length:3333 start_codon:yes stop_codon:yes gene_type:complete
MIPGQAQQFFEAAAAQSGGDTPFQVTRSLRFNGDDSANLSRTPSSASNRKTWTWSGWVKRSELSATQGRLFGGGTSDYFDLYFPSGNELRVIWTGGSLTTTTEFFRDASAWYHIVLAVDTTQSTAGDRIKIYVNGTLQDRSSTNPSQDYDTAVNNNVLHTIGRYAGSTSTSYFNGYLAEVHFIDGQALAPTEFGATDDNNNWNPKAYSGGSYGTNGFYLKFANNSTNAALGTDSSGNGNTWTVNNINAVAPGLSTANEGFDAVTYTGNSSSRNITGLAFAPDLVIVKATDAAYNHYWVDQVRGSNKNLYSNSDEATQTAARISSFNSDGFGLTNHTGVNNSGTNYVAWAWKAGGSGSSNTDGTITSTVSANSTYGFSIVTYTGNSTAGATIGHGLSTAPRLVIIKNRDRAVNWVVGSEAAGSFQTGRLYLNATSAQGTDEDFFNDTSPTSSVFSVKNNYEVNYSGEDYVAYCWHEVSGFSKFDSYTGNGSSSGPIVTMGFTPKFVMVKRTDDVGNWTIFDSARSLSNDLKWNTTETEGSAPVAFLGDGFQPLNSYTSVNANGGTYIYMAFAAKPDESIIDSLIDSPENYEADTGNNGGNYCTWNVLQPTYATTTFSNGNLDCSLLFTNGSATSYAAGTIAVSSGKWYWEVTIRQASNDTEYIGLIDGSKSSGAWAFADIAAYFSDARKAIGTTPSSYGASYTTGDVIGIALDADSNNLTFYKNGVSQGVAATGMTGFDGYKPFISSNGTGTAQLTSTNWGQREFKYTPPTDHLALCTKNLTDPTVADGSTVFDVVLRSGGGVNKSFTTLRPGLVWEKRTDDTSSHYWFDVNRGNDKYISSNTNSAEGSSGGAFTFNTNSYVVSASFDWPGSATVVDWVWDAGASTVSNSDGSITSNVRANTSAGFSIVTFTGNRSSGATVGHGLNAAPKWIIVKNLDTSANWMVYHIGTGAGGYLGLNLSNAFASASSVWNNTTPGTSVFTLGADSESNGDGNDMLAYCFSSVAGYSAFGSFSSGSDPFIFTGFSPKFVILKRSDSAGHWYVYDSDRGLSGRTETWLEANGNSADQTHGNGAFQFLSNGFQPLGSDIDPGSGTFVYAAFAEHPFKTARAR